MSRGRDGGREGLFSRGTELLRYSSLGLEMGAAIVVGLLIGLWLDRTLGTKPWLTVVFFLLGVAAGFKNIFGLLREQSRKQGDDRGKDG